MLQLATGTFNYDELIPYVTANNETAITKAIEAAFKREGNTLGDYSSHKVGAINNHGQYPVEITYIDCCDDVETTLWQLRPVNVFVS